jgi:hypothetical protein
MTLQWEFADALARGHAEMVEYSGEAYRFLQPRFAEAEVCSPLLRKGTGLGLVRVLLLRHRVQIYKYQTDSQPASP